jgi:hypothetical protein
MSEPDYRSIPALAAYIDRIGAEQLNFRRFMVKEHKGHYYRERSLITIRADGEIRCSNKEHAPTKEEAEAIKDAIVREKFPRTIAATRTNLDELKTLTGKSSTLYEFVNAEDLIVMVQERGVYNNKKYFVPWTFFSDGIWRKMEPDGALPFWRPSAKCSKARIMIHEGCKAAKAVNDLLSDPRMADGHPWFAELSAYEHWGMIGGALAPHRSDYDALRREKPVEVVYVCDNDFPGKSALQEVSRHYGASLKGVFFDGRWPQGWDMADDMPKTFFTRSGRYKGPRLADMMLSATFATEIMPNPSGKGKGIITIRRSFTEEWYHCVTPEVFVHKDWPNRILTTPEFDNTVCPFSDTPSTSRLVKGDAASKSAVLKYTPAEVSGVYGDGDAGRFINTHCPSTIEAEDGDASPWLNFMEHLVPDEKDRHELLRWIATLIARPDIKMLYGVLMISETQGVGKGTLGERVLCPLIGPLNVSFPSEQEIVDSNYNYWLAHKRLAVVHEIYAGHSSKAYNRLKSIVTDRYLTVSKKYQANYEVENWIHIYACSNSMRAIQLTTDDRRWFVPQVSEKKKPSAYWGELNDWLTEDGGLAIIKGWAHKFVDEHGPVRRGDAAPWSKLKKEIIEEGFSQGMGVAADLLDTLKSALDGTDLDLRKKLEGYGQLRGDEMVISDRDLVEFIKNKLYDGRHNDRLERPLTIRKVAKTKGWHISETKVHHSESLRRIQKSRLICSTKDLSQRRSVELFGEGVEKINRLLPVDLTLFQEL